MGDLENRLKQRLRERDIKWRYDRIGYLNKEIDRLERERSVLLKEIEKLEAEHD